MPFPNAKLDKLTKGVSCFNHGRYWQAHEEWEQVWRTLDGAEKTYLQGFILAAGAFVLLEKGRLSPAKRLASMSLNRFSTGSESRIATRLVCASLLPFLHLLSEADETTPPETCRELLNAAQNVKLALR